MSPFIYLQMKKIYLEILFLFQDSTGMNRRTGKVYERFLNT